MMATSLALDGDLVLGPDDATRLFREFPYGPARNLIVMTDDGWRTVFYGKPYLYSLFAAPLAGLFGANGMLLCNMLLVVAMIGLGWRFLADRGDEGTAAVLAAGFFLLSAGFAYAFWLQPEIFQMAAVAACCYLGLGAPRRRRVSPMLRAAFAGSALALAVYGKPMLAAVALGPLAGYGRRRWREAAGFVAGAALTLGLAAGLATALTGHPSAYLGVERQGVTLCEPGVVPIGPGPEGGAATPADRPTGGAWSWIFRLPTAGLAMLPENLLYFFVGRHAGLLPYFPFALACLLLFAAAPRRDRGSWGLLAGIGLVALFFLLFIPRNWQGGGGFVGNRYFVNVYPAFLFLVPRLRPRAVVPVAYAVGGLFLMPLLLTPFSRVGPEPTLQGHVRNAPFAWLPLEHTLREVPGYVEEEAGDVRLQGRRDVFLPHGDGSFWVRGASRVEVWIRSPEPLRAPLLAVDGFAPRNRIRLSSDEASEELELGAGERRLVTLPLTPRGDEPPYLHRLVVETEGGDLATWTRHVPPPVCPTFAYNEAWDETFYRGAGLVFLGAAEAVEADVYAVRFGAVDAPSTLVAGQETSFPVALVNRSQVPWRRGGAARVRLAYHWLDAADGTVVAEGPRTDLPLPLAPGKGARVRLRVEAPARPGSYVLQIEPLVEHVAWFSSRVEDATVRVPVAVTPAATGAP
jgi:hypothetical protein